MWVRVIRRELAETRALLRPVFAYPAGWFDAATCVHLHESVDWHWGPNHHPGQSSWNGYYNGFQFVLSTWRSTYAPGEPHGYTYDHPEAASVAEQYRRAFVNWQRNGNRFGGGQWPRSSRTCGVA